MVRQAHTYLVGAMSGATLIAIAIAVFVLLVSAQVFRDWPIAGLTGSGETAVHSAQPLGEIEGTAGSTAAASAGEGPGAAGAAGGKAGGAAGGADGGRAAVGSEGTPASAGQGGEPAGSGGAQGGGGAGTPSGQGAPAAGGNSSSPASGGGAGGGGGSSASSPSKSVTDTVNGTVTKVDETVTGGALGDTGVTGVTEGVVEGVVGPESTVGKVVDETVNTVGGILGGKP